MYSWTACQIKTHHYRVPVFGPYWLDATVVKRDLDHTNKFENSFLIRTIKVRLMNCRAFVITIGLFQLFLNPMHCPQIDTKTLWNVYISDSAVNSKAEQLAALKFLEEKIDFSLCIGRENLQQTKRMLEINNFKWWQFNHRTLYLNWYMDRFN